MTKITAEEDSSNSHFSLLRLTAIGIIHIGVGMGIVAISSFLNSELAFTGWDEGRISIYLGIPILFELTRLIFGYWYDTKKWLLRSLILGSLLGGVSLVLIPHFLFPVGNFLIIFIVSLYYAGTAILTTLVDTYMTESAQLGEKGRIAGVIQTLRLVGFALGGFVGSILYTSLSFDRFFTILSVIFILMAIISLISIQPTSPRSDTPNRKKSESTIWNTIREPLPILMILFLLLYPIGLFMQDLILEPFAIKELKFSRESVGRIVAIWTSLTLVFVPVGVYLERRLGKEKPIISGEFLAVLGLITIATTHYNSSLTLFYSGIVLFGIGNGLASAPAISVMLDVASLYRDHVAILLGIFGLFSTVGRFLAATIGGLILILSNNNYFLLFIIESLIVVIGLIPLLILLNRIHPVIVAKRNEFSSARNVYAVSALDY
jgi:MFS family permease